MDLRVRFLNTMPFYSPQCKKGAQAGQRDPLGLTGPYKVKGLKLRDGKYLTSCNLSHPVLVTQVYFILLACLLPEEDLRWSSPPNDASSHVCITPGRGYTMSWYNFEGEDTQLQDLWVAMKSDDFDFVLWCLLLWFQPQCPGCPLFI